jgi:DNA polymerase (family X)
VPKIMSSASQENRSISLNNGAIADRLGELAEYFVRHGANEFKVRAYRNASQKIRSLDFPIASKATETDELVEMPGIGQSIAQAVKTICRTGTHPLLSSLPGKSKQSALLATVPGLGPKTAEMIHEKLGIETLEDLEIAASDGRLAALPGIGRKRIRSIKESLAGRFQHYIPTRLKLVESGQKASIADLLSIDDEYRQKAALRHLPEIAPRRFNPEHRIWLPILRTTRNGVPYTAMYSNTALAHQLGKTHDWVVIYADKSPTGPTTIVTSHRGPTSGKRVVRGRESECLEYYRAQAASTGVN